jgi:tetratricopeptide (TPR) repeat protein
MGKYMTAIFMVMLVVASSATARTSQAQGQSQQPAQGTQPSAPPSGQASQSTQQTQGGQATQNGQPAPSGQGQAAPGAPAFTPEENKAYNAIKNELDPVRQLQLVDDFAKKYPNQPLILSEVYFYGAYASQQQNNVAKAVDYGYKSLESNPTNLRSLLMMSGLLPQPQVMQGSDSEKEKKLTDAETDANKALQEIPDLKQPNMPPDQISKAKASLESQAHASLGMVHLQRAMMGLTGADPQELGKSEQEYKASVTGTEKPNAEDYFRLGEVYEMENKADDAIDAFTQCSKLSQGPLQTMAGQQIDKLKKAKAQSPPPAKP